MASLSLVFDILAKDNASGTFRNVGDAADRAGKQTSTFGTAMSGAMKMAGAALIGGGLIQGFKNLYQAADESRKIAALTSQVIKTTGGAAGVSAKQVGDLAASIAKKTGVDDEAIQSGSNLLLTFTNIKNAAGEGNDIFNQTTQIMTDMSVALGKDASSSAIMLGKALNDPIKGISALSRAGVSFTEQQKTQIRTLVESGDVLGAQKIILAELGREFGGAAEAAATPLGKLQQRAGDLAEQLGGYLVPAVDKAATWASEKLLPALSDLGGILNATVVPAVKVTATAIGAVAGFFSSLPGPIQTAVVALGAFALLRGPLTGFFDSVVLGASKMIVGIDRSVTAMGALKGAAGGAVGMLGGPWGVALAAGTVLVTSFMSSLSKAKDQTDSWAQSLAKGGDAARRVAAEAQAIRDKQPFDWMADLDEWAGFSPTMDDATAALARYRAGLDPVAEAQSRVTEWTNTLADRMQNLGAKHGDTVIAQERLAYWTDVLGEREGFLAAATDSVAGSTDTFAQELEVARGEMDEAKQAVDNFKLALDLLTGTNVSLIQVETAFGDALRAAEGAMEGLDGSVLNADGSLNAYSESGSKAADVLLDVRNSGNTLISTMIQQGATADQVAAKDAELRASFIRTAGQMGITGSNAETLADQILGIPGSRNTVITANTSQAATAIAGVAGALRGIIDKTITVRVQTQMSGLNGGPQPIGGRAAGGPIAARTPYLVGEQGPELIFPSKAGFVATAQQTRSIMAHSAVYDGGGLLPPGFTMAYNGTGRNETIRTAAQEKALGGGNVYNVNLNMNGIDFNRAQDRKRVVEQVVSGIREFERERS